MAQVDFDPTKIKKVSIDKVIPNTWNPKEKNTKEYEKLRESIFTKGLRGAVAVRVHPTKKGKYEIIDGEQRYTAAKELGYEEIHIYNEGVVDDKEAKELTIWWQQQVPFEKITEAYLVAELVEAHGIENVELPYSEAEIAQFQNLAEFKFEDYKNEDEKEPEFDGDVKTLKLTLSKEAYDIIKTAMKRVMDENSCGEARALELIAADYLSEVGAGD